MAEYHILTTWDIQAPIETVWGVLSNPTHLSDWWKYVAGVSELEPNEADGTGGLFLYRWKTALPYTIAFEMRVTQNNPPHVLEGQAHGEVDGVGRWELKALEGFTRVTYDWRVRTTQAWMNLFAPVARPVFSWNHNTVMDEGGRALAALLGARLLAARNEFLN